MHAILEGEHEKMKGPGRISLESDASLPASEGRKATRLAQRDEPCETSPDRGWRTLARGFPSRWLLARRMARFGAEAQRSSGDDERTDTPRPRWSPAFPNIRWLLALVTVVHRRLYLSSGGRIGQSFGRLRFLLLVHTGRRTGRSFVAPLLYVEDGESWVVAASNAGDERNPNWLLNLECRPRTEIQVRSERIVVEARRASPEERRRLWPKLVESYWRFTNYRARTRREIAIVILERAA